MELISKTAVVLLLCAVAVSAENYTDFGLPQEYIQCNINDTAFGNCVKKALQRGIPHLSPGYPSLGLPQVDPLHLPVLEIRSKITWWTQLEVKLRNVDIHNLSKLNITDLAYNVNNFTMSFTSEVPSPIHIVGNYFFKYRLFYFIPLASANEPINITLSDFKLSGAIQFMPSKIGDMLRLRVENVLLHVNASNLFPRYTKPHEDTKLNAYIFPGKNYTGFLQFAQVALERALSVVFGNMIQKFFNRVPLEHIFIIGNF